MKNDVIDCLILDWGTTNFRAFAMNQYGNLVDKHECKLGLLQVYNGTFADTLQSILSNWLGKFEHLPILMAGMVGSAQGWINVPYTLAPIKMSELETKLYNFQLPWGGIATIIPGISFCDKKNNYEVMRGEEVQLFGLLELTGKSTLEAVFPGTHSKHMEIIDNTLMSFKTYMTGELFSVLLNHSILGIDLPVQETSKDAFEQGLLDSENEGFTNQLFKVRTHRLFGNLAPEEISEYLSGLLIGYEVRELKKDHVYLIGSENLCQRYNMACQLLNKTSEKMNGNDCFLAGMLKIKEVMKNEKASI